MIIFDRTKVNVVIAIDGGDGIANWQRYLGARLVGRGVNIFDLVDDIDLDTHHEGKNDEGEGQFVAFHDECCDK
jgi:hypothetical protein